jgi:hypothetical protein
MKLQFLLYVIILGLVLNLLANMIWKYIPGTNRHLDKIITVALVGICVILLAFYNENKDSYTTITFPEGTTLESAIKQLAQEHQASVRCDLTCTDILLNRRVRGESLSGRNIETIMMNLPYHLRDKFPTVRLYVKFRPERGLYDIKCST